MLERVVKLYAGPAFRAAVRHMFAQQLLILFAAHARLIYDLRHVRYPKPIGSVLRCSCAIGRLCSPAPLTQPRALCGRACASQELLDFVSTRRNVGEGREEVSVLLPARARACAHLSTMPRIRLVRSSVTSVHVSLSACAGRMAGPP